MTPTPRLNIDLDKIEHNARVITGVCAEHGIGVTGITKGTCGHPEVARAMLRGGVADIGDSRLRNIQRLRAAGIDVPFTLIRLPALSAVDAVVSLVDTSLNAEISVVQSLSAAARAQGRVHGVIIMVELGDLREGALPEELINLAQQTAVLPGIRIRGIGVNLGCFAGVMPDADNMNRLVALAESVEQTLGEELELISGLNSGGLQLLAQGDMPERVNHARIGEAILLGRETTVRQALPGAHQDAFVLYAELLELKLKPSTPSGLRGEDAFGGSAQFETHGSIVHALLNVGREDVDISGLTPLDPGVRILGASSGYLILDMSHVGREIQVGQELAFTLSYSALLRAMTSEYVVKELVGGA
jgi:predicted amino acid racemase